jgi:hypothetical protein
MWSPKADPDQHYSPAELAGPSGWGYSVSTIRRLFENEHGVMRLTKRNPRKRQYTTMQISQAAALRVYRKLQEGHR